MAGHFDADGHWVSGQWYEPDSQYRPALDKRLPDKTEFKCIEVSPGILYVVELPMGSYALHLEKNSIVPIPHGANLSGTFEASFPYAADSRVMIPVEEL